MMIEKKYALLMDGIIEETQYSVETRLKLIEYNKEDIGVLYEIVRYSINLPILRRIPLRYPSL